MPARHSRRRFLQTSLATGVAFAGYHVHPGQAAEVSSPNERLNIAAIGATGRAGANVSEVSTQNLIAIADVDSDRLDKGSAKFPAARKYRDYRVMLEKEAEHIDAVLVGTPDHSHAPAAAMALRLGKHVYCEKPLTHTVHEARTLAKLAQEKNLVTQMGTQIHAQDNYRRVVELIESGAIGKVQEVHVWASAVYTGAKFTTGTKAPDNLDWDLWLGPATERPYSEGVHPFDWRRFWDYGTGSLDDEYEYPARGDLPPVKLTWYDSGRKPELATTLERQRPLDVNGKPFVNDKGTIPSAQLFVGEKGLILSNYTQRCTLPAASDGEIKIPEPYIPASIGHHAEWLNAIKNGGPTTCNFDYSGALTESVLLGTVAYRAGEKIEWDSENLQVKNSEKAQHLVHKEYRKGWTL